MEDAPNLRRNGLQETDRDSFRLCFEVLDCDVFAQRTAAAKASQTYGACVKQCGTQLFQSVDGEAFAAVTREGELINVVRHRKRSTTNNFYAVMVAAIVMGGAIFLECMYTVTVPVYMRCGFIPVARSQWNDHFSPHDWDKKLFRKFNDGGPYNMYMVWGGKEEGHCVSVGS